MFGLVLLIPVVMYTALLYPVIARGVFPGFDLQQDGFDFGFLIRRFCPQARRSYYLF